MTTESNSNDRFTRRSVLAAGSVMTFSAIAGCAGSNDDVSDEIGNNNETNGNDTDNGENTEDQMEATEVTVRQEPGNAFYWVFPGERRLSPRVFGTAENPRFGSDLLESRIEEARGFPSPLNEAIPQLLQDLPFLVAAPEEAREPIEDPNSIAQQRLAEPILYSDEAEITSGEFEITYQDQQPYDLPGEPGDTDDTVDLETQFTDPAGSTNSISITSSSHRSPATKPAAASASVHGTTE